MRKRVFDIILSLVILFFLSPLIILIAVLVRFKLGSPILFIQKRPGKNGVPFSIVKFRTMINIPPDIKEEQSTDIERLTKFGKFLRSLSLDELPEFWNVLKGDMSIVGPRPLLMEYLPLYTPAQMRRHEVRPGMTGWAQINGRNALSWEDKFDLDIWYINNYSYLLDIKIILLTIIRVIRREGITAEGHVTAERFMGKDK